MLPVVGLARTARSSSQCSLLSHWRKPLCQWAARVTLLSASIAATQQHLIDPVFANDVPAPTLLIMSWKAF